VTGPALDPLADAPTEPAVAALPKAELHVHAEASARMDALLARREGRRPYQWRRAAARLMAELPPRPARLERLNGDLALPMAELEADPENVVARIADALEEAAADGALLVEVMFGGATILYPDFVALFREAERRTRARHPRLRAEPLIALYPHRSPQELLEACRGAARDGLAGVNLLPTPYDAEADWAPMRDWAARAADAGLGVAVHAGEFSPANLAAALATPGVGRLGHAVHAARDPRLLDALARSGLTVECPLTCNVVLGAVASYEDHPIRRFVERGIPVTLCTDNPVRVGTTIGREYAVAAALGFTPADLLGFTRNAARASFAPPAHRSALLAELGA
jgi:adenosine deaminase